MILKNNEPCPQCGRYNNRGVTVDAVIVRENEILLIKRGSEPFKGFWALPGGYVDWDEMVEDAAKREVAEETGLTVISLELIGVFSKPERHPKQCVSVAYAAQTTGDVKVGDDAVEYQWTSTDELPELAFDHKEIIEKYLRK